jgi:hypothetical protein
MHIGTNWLAANCDNWMVCIDGNTIDMKELGVQTFILFQGWWSYMHNYSYCLEGVWLCPWEWAVNQTLSCIGFSDL